MNRQELVGSLRVEYWRGTAILRSVAVPVAIVLIAVLACGNPYIVNGYKSPMGFGGQRLHPHTGIDFKAELGDPILAAADGDVAESTYFEDAGNVIVIGHRRSPEGYAYFTAYLHLDKREVRIGESVRRGDQIGRAGSTGWGASGRVHLHFQLCTFLCLAGTENGNFKGVEDPLTYSAGCFDPRRTYDDGDRLILTYPIECDR